MWTLMGCMFRRGLSLAPKDALGSMLMLESSRSLRKQGWVKIVQTPGMWQLRRYRCHSCASSTSSWESKADLSPLLASCLVTWAQHTLAHTLGYGADWNSPRWKAACLLGFWPPCEINRLLFFITCLGSGVLIQPQKTACCRVELEGIMMRSLSPPSS